MPRGLSKKKVKLITYVDGNIDNLSITHKKHIFEMLRKDIGDDKIMQKKDGCQIRFSDIKIKLLEEIKEYISKVLEERRN